MPAAILVLCALFATGCGGEREFQAGEFVDAANEEGAGLVLGDSLTSIEEDVEVFAMEFAEDGDHAEDEPKGGHAHSGGSLIVAGDAESATEEFERCESAVTLTCYRAANVVLFFDAESTPEHVARVDAAIRALGSD